jgi:LysM repeat protein
MNKIFTYLLIVISLQVFAGKRFTPQDYLDKYTDDAIEEMNRTGVPASITLAQGMLESGYGNSRLAIKANNHFGIKCHSDWIGPIFRVDDDKKEECFRKYKSVKHSFRDHSNFLTGKKRYASLFDLKITDYKGWARGLRKAGYATNKKYAKLLIDIIERYDLNQYVKKKGKKKKKEAKKKDKIIESEENDNLEVSYSTSKIKVSDNWIKYVNVTKGYTFYKISKETGVPVRRLYRYNECDKNTILSLGDRVYLQPKKRNSKTKSYIFKEGDDLYRISQEFGVKLKSIYKRNRWSNSYKPVSGVIVTLKGRKRKI